MTKERPTKKQREMLTFVENFITGHGYGPSYREIKAGMGYSSVATVAKHIDNLIKKGHLSKRDNSARSLELIGQDAPDDILVRGEAPSEEQEKWLVAKIAEKFAVVEAANPIPPEAIDELYVLVGALNVLEFEGAAQSFMSRIGDLKRIAEKQ